MSEASTTNVQSLIERMNAGDFSARNALICHSAERLRRLTVKMFHDYSRLGRWEEVEDVMQSAVIRLLQALHSVKPASATEFFRLATRQIRWELLDLARHHFGPQGPARNHATSLPAGHSESPVQLQEPASSTLDPVRLAEWTEFHERVKNLPAEQQDVFDLLWYQGLTRVEAAAALNVSVQTVRRHWMAARLALQDALSNKED